MGKKALKCISLSHKLPTPPAANLFVENYIKNGGKGLKNASFGKLRGYILSKILWSGGGGGKGWLGKRRGREKKFKKGKKKGEKYMKKRP